MSTPNFRKENANDFYVIYDPEEENPWFYEDICENLIANAESWEDISKNDIWTSERHLPMHSIVSKESLISFGGMTFTVSAEIGIRSGYYSGANLDYEVSIASDWCGGDLDGDDAADLVEAFVEDCYDDYEYERWGWNAGLASMLKKKLTSRLCKAVQNMVDECEKICQRSCDEEYVCTGIFSNGEAVYEKKSPRSELKAIANDTK